MAGVEPKAEAPLTVKQANTILSEILEGKPLSIPGEKAKKMRALFERDVAKIRAEGGGKVTINLPGEL